MHSRTVTSTITGLLLISLMLVFAWHAITPKTSLIIGGEIIVVGAGGSLQAALDQAVPGNIIELEPGAVFQGPFVLRQKPSRSEVSPAKDKPLWITIRSGVNQKPNAARLPPAGIRVSPADAPAMARLESTGNPVLSANSGAHHYRFVGIEFSSPERETSRIGKNQLTELIRLESQDDNFESIPHHFIFERCYLHGDPQGGTRRGIIMNSAYTEVVDSYFSDFKVIGEDSQAIVSWSGPGPFTIRNNYLEAAGENVMFGGWDPTIDNLVPSDIEIRGNYFSRPEGWQPGNPDYKGTDWSVKNLLELKNARRVVIDGNLFEHNWPESQNGFAILFTVRNQQGTAPWSVVEDVTFSNNIIRQAANGINILGRDDNYSSQKTRRITIYNNFFENLGGHWGGGDLFQLLDGTEDVTITRNTALQSGRILIAEGDYHRRFVFTDNIVMQNKYGIVGTDTAPGMATLERYFPDAEFRGNQIVGGLPTEYPAGNQFPASLAKTTVRPTAAEGQNAVRLQPVGVDFSELCAALSEAERAEYCQQVSSAEH